jgi:predicted  nucleic acid-binding Zn-ribbon protein
LLIPIFALAIPVTAIIFAGLQKVARIRLEEARLRAKEQGGDGEIAALRSEVADLRQELEAVQERLDFAERLLGQARDQQRVSGRREP